MIALPLELTPITDSLLSQGFYPVVVGGYIRDQLIERDSKDIDIEVYAIRDLQTLEKVLSPFGNVNMVGKSFGVLKMKLGLYEIDFSLPRKEYKSAIGHRGFNVQLSGQLDFVTAALRRDFTMNAIGYDINSSLLLDPYGGQKDLEEKVLRCVNEATFVEDPLRVLRAVQMCARFDLTCDPELRTLMTRMVKDGMLNELPKERLFEELKKLLLKAPKPSVGFRLMDELGVLEHLPHLKALKHIEQDPDYHPEGNVWEHTLLALDTMAAMRSDEQRRNLVLMLATLCHDFGKATEQASHGVKKHAPAGVEPTRKFLDYFTEEKGLINEVAALVEHHEDPRKLFERKADDGELRRLAMKVHIRDLIQVARADYLGRAAPQTATGVFEAGDWLLEHAGRLGIIQSAIKPLLQGRDLVALGFKPSPLFKDILDAAFEAQLDGEFDTYQAAQAWLHKRLQGVTL
jgi:tRNA nucleotidyltransferase (CCA-adding enzyme)